MATEYEGYLSLSDPCPHITRIDVITAKLHGLSLSECEQCEEETE